MSRSWSYMKFPFIRDLGPETGWYRVGPLARMNTASFIDTPLANAAHRALRAVIGRARTIRRSANHWARMIEVVHCVEKIRELLHDPDLQGTDLVAKGERRFEGIGVIEAPRGNLIHHYKVDENDQVTYLQPDRVDHPQQRGHEPRGQGRGGQASVRPGQDHRRHAEPCRGRDPRL